MEKLCRPLYKGRVTLIVRGASFLPPLFLTALAERIPARDVSDMIRILLVIGLHK